MQTEPLLGLLEKVELRNTWPREDVDFTPWLAKQENLKLIGDAMAAFSFRACQPEYLERFGRCRMNGS